MRRRQFLLDLARHGFVIGAGTAAGTATGCGSFMYSERCGQLHSSQIDWKVVALDSLGLILFFVPGIVAFIVDFYTGAIYLPAADVYPGYAAYRPAKPDNQPESLPLRAPPATADAGLNQPGAPAFGLKRVMIPGGQLQRERIERLVSQHVGRPVSLSDAQTRASRLEQIAQYEEQARRHRDDAAFGFDARPVLERLISG